ncbi:MAG: hypothetical protein AB8B64_24995 [Granulosicoccus sp.]
MQQRLTVSTAVDQACSTVGYGQRAVIDERRNACMEHSIGDNY